MLTPIHQLLHSLTCIHGTADLYVCVSSNSGTGGTNLRMNQNRASHMKSFLFSFQRDFFICEIQNHSYLSFFVFFFHSSIVRFIVILLRRARFYSLLSCSEAASYIE